MKLIDVTVMNTSGLPSTQLLLLLHVLSRYSFLSLSSFPLLTKHMISVISLTVTFFLQIINQVFLSVSRKPEVFLG